MYSNGIRFSGLASGMDTEGIVKQLMQTQRLPLDRMKQDKQSLEWKRDDFRSMNKEMEQFRTYLFDKMLRKDTFVPKKVESSNSSVVTATANANAPEVTTSIQVTKLATSSSWVSEGQVNSDWKNGITFTDGKAELQFITSGVTDPIKITLNETDTLEDVFNKINASKLGVTMMKGNFDHDNNPNTALQETVVFTNKTTGSGMYNISLENAATQQLMQNLGFSAGTGLSGFNEGQDAELTINGMATIQKSNTFQISGVTYTLQNTGNAKITSKTDVDLAISNIKEFVTKYNEFINKINGKLEEPKYRSYRPLTDDQKKSMSEKEVELWEERAKSGLLKGDSILASGLLSIRTALYSKVLPGEKGISEEYDTLTEVGLTTTKNYRDGGNLEIDETKLRKALETNPNAVYELFTKTTDSDLSAIKNEDLTLEQRKEKYNESGLVVRLRELLYDTIKKVEEKAGNSYIAPTDYTIGKNIRDLDNKMVSFERRLQQIEDRYWNQFTAMEKAMQKANEQSGWLSQQLAGMNK